METAAAQIKISTSNLQENTRITIPLLVQKKERRIGVNTKVRLEVVGTDSDGSIIINFWDNDIDKFDNQIKEGHIYNISGVTSLYNGRIDISGKYIEEIVDDKFSYIPKYIITEADYKIFDTMINYLPASNKQLVEALTGYNTNIELWNKFINIPVTERHHYNKIGGLFLHSLSVTKLVSRIIKNYPAGIVNNHRLITKALLHDIGKLDSFEIDTNTFMFKKIERDIKHNIIGSMKILTCNNKMNLFNAEEIDNIAYGVMCHKGEFGEVPIKSIEDEILHHTDTLDVDIFKSINIMQKNN